MSSQEVKVLPIPTSIPTTLDAVQIAAFSLQNANHLSVQIQSTQLRISVLEKANIKPGSKVLEVGCGQGDSTAVLAVVVGEGGKVVAIDPGPPDYGSPYTLAQAQAHLLQGLGSRIIFLQTTPIEHVQSLSKDEGYEYDYAILSLCTFYFSSPTVLRDTFKALSTKCKEIFVAEWSLTPSKLFPLESYPHVAAVLLRAAVDSRTLNPTSNCRTLLSPTSLKQMITGDEMGLKCVEEGLFDSPENNLEGRWEVDMVLGNGFEKKVQKTEQEMKELELKIRGKDARTEEEIKTAQEAKERGVATILAARDSIRANLPEKGIKGVKSMSIWYGRFTR